MKSLINFRKLSFLALFISILITQSCTKDQIEPIQQIEMSKASTFQIVFSSKTIDFNKVDSVVASFSRAGQAANFTKKLTKGTDRYFLEKSDLKDGAWTVNVSVYSTEDASSSRRYIFKKDLPELQHALVGPVIKINDAWAPYIVLKDNQTGIEAILSERQDDPAFELTLPETSWWDYIYLDRVIYRGDNFYDAVGFWENKGKITGTIRNTTAFSAYTAEVKTKQWATSEVLLYLEGEEISKTVEIYYIYNNRYIN